MAIEKIRLGTKDDGSPLWHYHSPDGHLVFTGPNISGTATVTHPDGTEFVYDVSDLYTEVFDGHQLPLVEAVAQRFVEEGHPSHDTEAPFVATPVTVTHEADGTPKESFAKAVEDNAGPRGDSSPQGILNALSATPARTQTED